MDVSTSTNPLSSFEPDLQIMSYEMEAGTMEDVSVPDFKLMTKVANAMMTHRSSYQTSVTVANQPMEVKIYTAPGNTLLLVFEGRRKQSGSRGADKTERVLVNKVDGKWCFDTEQGAWWTPLESNLHDVSRQIMLDIESGDIPLNVGRAAV